jgi:hypothetical protein
MEISIALEIAERPTTGVVYSAVQTSTQKKKESGNVQNATFGLRSISSD